jgi:hypothetical protein
MATEYELIRASRWAGFRDFDHFDALDCDAQARIVAEYRTEQRLTAVTAALKPKSSHGKGRRYPRR